jgi:hypothetical protein
LQVLALDHLQRFRRARRRFGHPPRR